MAWNVKFQTFTSRDAHPKLNPLPLIQAKRWNDKLLQ
jgi:hypothetical protein